MLQLNRKSSTLHFYFILLLCIVFISKEIKAESSLLTGREKWRVTLTPSFGVFNDPGSLTSYENESNKQIIIEASPSRIIIEREVNFNEFNSNFKMSDVGIYSSNQELLPYMTVPTSRPVLKLAATLANGKTTQTEYVNAVVFYIRDLLTWQDTSVIDAEGTLRNRYSTCAGFANLMTALLRAKGIPARVGLVHNLKHPSWNSGGHAEVEVYYEGSEWVSYDPQRHLHHAPFPRIYFGNSQDAVFSSTDADVWRQYSFLSRMNYNVKYDLLYSDVKQIGVIAEPKDRFLARRDNVMEIQPSIYGNIEDGNGNPMKLDWIYFGDHGATKYQGTQLLNGSYSIPNPSKGIELFLNKNGYVVRYKQRGGIRKEHNIYFDERDSIIISGTAKVEIPGSNGMYFQYQPGSDGLVRLHLNEDTDQVVNGELYSYYNGRWVKQLD